jgi:hypothetical protein
MDLWGRPVKAIFQQRNSDGMIVSPFMKEAITDGDDLVRE